MKTYHICNHADTPDSNTLLLLKRFIICQANPLIIMSMTKEVGYSFQYWNRDAWI